MDERVIQFRVGIVVLCAILILGILIFLFGEGWTPQYTVYAQPSTAPGVTKNTPIRRNGVLIGRVADVKSLDNAVLLTLKINGGEKVYENDVCKIGTASLLGDAVLEFLPGDQQRGELLTNGKMIDNVIIERNPIEVIEMGLRLENSINETLTSIKNAGDRVDSVGKDIQDIANNVAEAFSDEQGDPQQFFQRIASLSVKAEKALDNFDSMMTNVNNVIGDENVQSNLKQTIENLPTLLEEAENVFQEASQTIAEFRDVNKLLEENLGNLKGLTEALGEDGPEITRSVRDSLKSVEGLIDEVELVARQVNQLMRSINQGDGSINRLIKDPSLYNNINDTVRNIKQITSQLQPLVNDARYIVDGLARDPGQVGVRGLLNRKPPNTGYKGSAVGADRVNYK
jgi:phospholipid/cholesterol/gamma-HCH transport system substrate-binding protein